MVVPVLITSCQVSEKLNSGPVTAQTTTSTTHARKAAGLPVTWAVQLAKRANLRSNIGQAQAEAYAATDFGRSGSAGWWLRPNRRECWPSGPREMGGS